MRKRQAVTAVVGVAMLLSACGQAARPTPTSTPSAPTTPAASTTTTPAQPVEFKLDPAAACQAFDSRPEPVPGIPPASPSDWSEGATTTTTVLIEYGDYQWPGCAGVQPLVAGLVDSHKDLKLVYRHFPLITIHDKAQTAAEAAEAAGAQGKFWEMHTQLYTKQSEWASQTVTDFVKTAAGYAKNIGLDVDRFSKDLAAGTYRGKIEAAYQQAGEAGLPGTPTFFLNGIYIPSDQLASIDSLFTWFRWLDSKPTQYPAPDKVIDPAKKYTATLKTAKGDIVIELYAAQAPNIVNSFVFLARKGYYNGVTFHRVLQDFVAQGGDPSGTGIAGPGYRCKDEIQPTLKFDGPGVVAMANAGADTNGSQFFITYAPLPQLDGRFSIFGRVISGLEAAKALKLRDPQKEPNAAPGDAIQSIVIEEK